MRFIHWRKATILGLAVALCALCALPGVAAPTTADDAAAPSWGTRLIERTIDSIAGWLGFDGKGNDSTGGDGGDGGFDVEGGFGDPQTNECPPTEPTCEEGGPDWDPNG